MRTAAGVLAAMIATLASNGGADERPTAESLLAGYQKSVEKLSPVRIAWTRESKAAKATDQYTLWRDGARWRIDRQFSFPAAPDKGIPESRSREEVIIGDDVLLVSQTATAPDFQPGQPRVSSYRGEVSKRMPPVTGKALVFFGCITGDGGHPIWTVMRESGSLELLPGTAEVDGVETYVLTSKGKYGQHKVWLDPVTGGLPRRIEVQKGPGDLRDEEQLGTVPAPPAGTEAQGRTPGALPPQREYSYRVDRIRIEKKQDSYVIIGFEDATTLHFIDGRKTELQETIQVQAFGMNPNDVPKNALELDIDIPNGTIVFVREPGQDRSAEKYEWFDGKVRKRVGN